MTLARKSSNLKKPHVVMIVTNEYFPDDIRVFKEAVSLSKEYDISVILWDRSGKMQRYERFGNIQVHRVRLKSSYTNSLSTIVKLPLFWLLTLPIILSLRANAIHCHDFDTLPVGCFIKIINRHVKLIFDSHEHYPSMIHGAVSSAVEKIVSSLFVCLPRLSDGIIVVNDYLAEFFKKAKNLAVIMNTPAHSSVSFQEKTTGNRCNKFRIFYFGELTKDRGIYCLIDVATKNPYIELILAGSGPEKHVVEKYSKEYDNIKYRGWINNSKILEFIESSDLIPILYSSEILNNKIATPNKLFLAMKYGKPVVVYQGTLPEYIVRKERIGFSIKGDNIAELEKIIFQLASDRSLVQSISENGRRAFEEEYNWEIMADRLLLFYKSVFNSKTYLAHPSNVLSVL